MFLEYKDISSKEAYEFYKENRKTVVKGISRYSCFKKAVEGMVSTLTKMIIENENGVCIRDLGYFCMIKNKNKTRFINLQETSLLKRRGEKQTYTPYLFFDIMYEGWYMEHTFSKGFKQYLQKSKKTYKMHKQVCDSLIVNEDFVKRMKEKNLTNPSRNNNYKKEARK